MTKENARTWFANLCGLFISYLGYCYVAVE